MFLKERQFQKKLLSNVSKADRSYFLLPVEPGSNNFLLVQGASLAKLEPNSLQSQSTVKAEPLLLFFFPSFLNSKISPSPAETATTALASSPSLVGFTWTLIAYIILKELKRFR